MSKLLKINELILPDFLPSGLFISLALVVSLFIYRPWCYFFCPFGLDGWMAEKISLFKIKVDYDKCIAFRILMQNGFDARNMPGGYITYRTVANNGQLR
jgi:polyferredoxin